MTAKKKKTSKNKVSKRKTSKKKKTQKKVSNTKSKSVDELTDRIKTSEDKKRHALVERLAKAGFIKCEQKESLYNDICKWSVQDIERVKRVLAYFDSLPERDRQNFHNPMLFKKFPDQKDREKTFNQKDREKAFVESSFKPSKDSYAAENEINKDLKILIAMIMVAVTKSVFSHSFEKDDKGIKAKSDENWWKDWGKDDTKEEREKVAKKVSDLADKINPPKIFADAPDPKKAAETMKTAAKQVHNWVNKKELKAIPITPIGHVRGSGPKFQPNGLSETESLSLASSVDIIDNLESKVAEKTKEYLRARRELLVLKCSLEKAYDELLEEHNPLSKDALIDAPVKEKKLKKEIKTSGNSHVNLENDLKHAFS